jgi:Zn finger protein HypA/HybF involved in hydrogenase expression
MASKRAVRRKQCDGKVRHADHETAQTACWKVRQKWGDRMFPYRCPHCGGYHIGHMAHRVLKQIGRVL